ncbi:rRNA (cytosine-C(5))-methyltransferase nop2c [Datura stramonium]|uniref:rRNA (Cytosine-C(5))-methyltransferase nop2c n=1 Tax=Datura stramonium TaxID=4076 RepID=A0ABS8SR78_DATST|nr:rRNA (cytosine-C(5))-methyltransferase nop2c [Datura stramonium]
MEPGVMVPAVLRAELMKLIVMVPTVLWAELMKLVMVVPAVLRAELMEQVVVLWLELIYPVVMWLRLKVLVKVSIEGMMLMVVLTDVVVMWLKDGQYTSKAELRKRIRQLKNGPGRNHTAGGRVEKSKGFSPNSFDRVLLDAPCSALGLRPRLFAGEDTIDSLRTHAKYQRRMFDQAVQLVRPGGVIVFSTCTINPGENEALVRYALDTYEFLSLASQHPKIGGPGLTGSCQLPDGFVEEWLKPGEENLVQRFDPSSDLDTIGFFIAKFSVGLKNI